MTTEVKLYSLSFTEWKTYAFAAMFIIGNIVFPQLCHTLHMGGPIFLPIYFFTLIGAYKYGMHVGLLTAILSPLVNSYFFGMPPVAGLPAILIKSVLLAIFAGVVAKRSNRCTILHIALVVLLYQVFGTMGEWALKQDFYRAAQDFRIGVPGMLIQILGGWLFVKFIIKK